MDSMGRYRYHVPNARGEELVRKQSKEDWDERVPLVGRLVYLREKDLRGRLSILEQRDHLQYFRVRKQQQLHWTRQAMKNNQSSAEVNEKQSGQHEQHERGQNKSFAEIYQEQRAALGSSDTLDGQEQGLSLKSTKSPEPTDNEWPQQSCAPDKPLDLSDYGRVRDASGSLEDIYRSLGQPVVDHQNAEQKTGHSPCNSLRSKEDNQCFRLSPPVTTGEQIQRDNHSDHGNAHDMDNDAAFMDWKSSPQGHDVGDSTQDESSGIRLRLSARRPKLESGTQPDDEDGETTKRESDELESSDSEKAVRYDSAGSIKEKMQGSMKKRKRVHDPWTKAHRRFSKGRKKGKAQPTQPAAEEMEKSTSSSSDVFRGT